MANEINTLEQYIVDHVEQAVKEGWIRAYFQPVVRTLTGQVAGFEALARWDDPTYGFLTPDAFIPALEKSGDIYQVDMAVLELICASYEQRAADGNDLVPVSFNLSRVDLYDEDLVRSDQVHSERGSKNIHQRINEICDRHGVPHEMIHIEITESTSYQKDAVLEEHIKWFHRDGYQVWMDDFGSGFSTFNTIQTHSFDVIKLDMLFLCNFNEKAEQIIRSIVKLAKSLGIGTVCEGVETAEQVEFLRSVGCERMQGWYFGRPQPLRVMMEYTGVNTGRYESLEEQDYGDVVSRVDILSGQPELLLEYESAEGEAEGSWNVLQRNPNMTQAMIEIHPEGIELSREWLRDPANSIHDVVYGVMEQVSRTHDTRQVDYLDNGYLIMLRVEYLASIGNRTALKLRLRNIHTELEYRRSSMLEEGLVGLYSQFELVNRIDVTADTAMQIYSNASFDKIYGKGSLREGVKEFTETEVHEEDRPRYRKYMDLDSLGDRITEQGANFITEAFRLSDKKGGFSWKFVTLLREPSSDGQKFLYEIQEPTQTMRGVLERLYEDQRQNK